MEAKIKTLLEKNTVSKKVTSHVKFNLNEVDFFLCEDKDKLDNNKKNKNEKVEKNE